MNCTFFLRSIRIYLVKLLSIFMNQFKHAIMKRNSNFKGLAVMALAVLFAFSCEKSNEDTLITDRDA